MNYRITVHNRDRLRRAVETGDWDSASQTAVAYNANTFLSEDPDTVIINGASLDPDEVAVVIAALTCYAELKKKEH